jgi:hypothetical protein
VAISFVFVPSYLSDCVRKSVACIQDMIQVSSSEAGAALWMQHLGAHYQVVPARKETLLSLSHIFIVRV